VRKTYKDRGTILRPGFIYGSRHVSKSVTLPLWLIGSPLGVVTDNFLARTIGGLPLLGSVLEVPLVPPVSVDSIGSAAVDAIQRESPSPASDEARVLNVSDIRRFS